MPILTVLALCVAWSEMAYPKIDRATSSHGLFLSLTRLYIKAFLTFDRRDKQQAIFLKSTGYQHFFSSDNDFGFFCIRHAIKFI